MIWIILPLQRGVSFSKAVLEVASEIIDPVIMTMEHVPDMVDSYTVAYLYRILNGIEALEIVLSEGCIFIAINYITNCK